MTLEVTVPDIGTDEKVDVVEILVAVGEEVAVEDGLITTAYSACCSRGTLHGSGRGSSHAESPLSSEGTGMTAGWCCFPDIF